MSERIRRNSAKFPTAIAGPGPGLVGTVSPPPFYPIPRLGERSMQSYQRPQNQGSFPLSVTQPTNNVHPSGLFCIDSTADPHLAPWTLPVNGHLLSCRTTQAEAQVQRVGPAHLDRESMLARTSAKQELSSDEQPSISASINDGQKSARGANAVPAIRKHDNNTPANTENDTATTTANKKQKRSKKANKVVKPTKKLTKAEKKKAKNEAKGESFFYRKIIEEKTEAARTQESKMKNIQEENQILKQIVQRYGFSEHNVDELLARVRHGETVKQAMKNTTSK